jgi:hypothetical protein
MDEIISFRTIGSGTQVQGRLIGGRERETKLLSEAEGYSFCQPFADSWKVVCPLAIETDIRSAWLRREKTRVQDWRARLNERAMDRRSAAKGLFLGRRLQDNPPKELDWTATYLDYLGSRLSDVYSMRQIPDPFDGYVYVYLSKAIVVATFFPEHDEIDAVVAAFRAGYIPLYWNGDWPNGHLEVYCPADRPHAHAGTVDWNDIKRAEKAQWDQLVIRHRAHPGYVSAPAVQIDHLAAWRQLASDASPAVVAAHFAPLASDAASRRMLTMIAERVVGIEIVEDDLAITVQNSDEFRLVLRCAPPWTDVIERLPAELIPLLRLHNGMRLIEPMDSLQLYPFNGKDFTISDNWIEALRRDGVFDDDPWTVAPVLLPLTNGQDLWVYHPTEPLPDGRAHLMFLSHETARTEALKGTPSIGPYFLHLLAYWLGLVESP